MLKIVPHGPRGMIRRGIKNTSAATLDEALLGAREHSKSANRYDIEDDAGTVIKSLVVVDGSMYEQIAGLHPEEIEVIATDETTTSDIIRQFVDSGKPFTREMLIDRLTDIHGGDPVVLRNTIGSVLSTIDHSGKYKRNDGKVRKIGGRRQATYQYEKVAA